MTSMRIGEVSQRSGVGIETIRYYEKEGLLAEPDRRPSGYRQYDPSVVSRLLFIRHAKELGFTLSEIRELLDLWFDTETTCEHVRRRAEQKLADIDDKIRTLQKMKRSLKKVIDQCEHGESMQECPLWRDFDSPRRGDNHNQNGRRV